MIRRLIAVAAILIATSLAWVVLGTTIFTRTFQRGPMLREKVVSNWGGTHAQGSPTAVVQPSQASQAPSPLPLESSRINAAVHLEYRQKGLLWYSTYGIQFAGRYIFRNPSSEPQRVLLRFPLPSDKAIYDDLLVTLNGSPATPAIVDRELQLSTLIEAGGDASFTVQYRSQGLDSWSYRFGTGVAQVRDFELRLATDFSGGDFPEGSLSPSRKTPRANGEDLVWTYRNLMTGQHIRLEMPQHLQPGPLAGEISYFAPVSLLFFFFVLLVITTIRGVDLHPVNYFFLAAAFFAFHLLFAYLVDHMPLHASFLISAAVSVLLVVSYLRLVVSFRFAAVEAGGAQFVYLVLFSYAFFLEGFTGLAITIGAILTLFVTMQMTARIRWGEPPTPSRQSVIPA